MDKNHFLMEIDDLLSKKECQYFIDLINEQPEAIKMNNQNSSSQVHNFDK